MGLDSYIVARKNFSSFNWQTEKADESFVKICDAVGVPAGFFNETYPSASVELTVGHWRKANQIHNWFVNNIMYGIDDCNGHSISEDVLRRLINTCESVMKDPRLCRDLLPTKSGCFFGSLEYDEYYFNDVAQTIVMLKKILNTFTRDNGWYLTYQASW